MPTWLLEPLQIPAHPCAAGMGFLCMDEIGIAFPVDWSFVGLSFCWGWLSSPRLIAIKAMCNLHGEVPKEDVERYVHMHFRELTLPCEKAGKNSLAIGGGEWLHGVFGRTQAFATGKESIGCQRTILGQT